MRLRFFPVRKITLNFLSEVEEVPLLRLCQRLGFLEGDGKKQGTIGAIATVPVEFSLNFLN